MRRTRPWWQYEWSRVEIGPAELAVTAYVRTTNNIQHPVSTAHAPKVRPSDGCVHYPGVCNDDLSKTLRPHNPFAIGFFAITCTRD